MFFSTCSHLFDRRAVPGLESGRRREGELHPRGSGFTWPGIFIFS